MIFEKIIKFKPIDLTQIILTVIILSIVIFAFKSQLDDFFTSLQNRPIKVTVSGSGATIEIDALVKPEILAETVSDLEGSEQDIIDWGQRIQGIQRIEDFAKLGFGDLHEKISTLGPNEFAVINYAVNDPNRFYFEDESMLRYLSIASEKVKYLAFYENNKFSGTIKIQTIIAGLASDNGQFRSFGEKIKNGGWTRFPGLITRESSFTRTPSVKDLQEFLTSRNLSEVPLINNNTLVGFLNYQSISNELYAQASANQL